MGGIGDQFTPNNAINNNRMEPLKAISTSTTTDTNYIQKRRNGEESRGVRGQRKKRGERGETDRDKRERHIHTHTHTHR